MTIWIVGKHGQLARALIKEGLKEQLPLISTSRDSVNLLNKKSVLSFAKTNKITSIINATAYTNVELAERERAQAFLINAKIPTILSSVSETLQIPLTHFSTDYVFNGEKGAPYTEEDTPAPLNVYGESKLAGEMAVLNGDLTLVIRTSWLMGLNGHNFIETLFKKAETVEQLTIVNDQIGKVTFCSDLAKAVFKLQGHVGLVHFANEGILSWYELASELPLPCKVIPTLSSTYPQIAKRPKYSALCLKKATLWLGEAPRRFKSPLNEYLELRSR